MLRNTAASKAAAGPLNTLDNKIVNVLNPQTELAAANTKIKQLQELLKARERKGEEQQRRLTFYAILESRGLT